MLNDIINVRPECIGVVIAVLAITLGHPLISRLLEIMGTRSVVTATPFQPELHFTRKQELGEKDFPQVSLLGDDIVAHVLSFVADAPFENSRGLDPNFVSSLTHSLPFVSKQFRRLVKRDCFWKDALIRQVSAEPLWNRGLMGLYPGPGQIPEVGNASELVEVMQTSLGAACKELYRRVLNEKIRFVGPIFYMGQSITLGEPYGLHFFEPRYRRLIAEVMSPFPASAKQGGPIECADGQSPPVFIHANVHPLTRSSPAVLVQVIRCGIHPRDGRADVFLLPIAYVSMERIWEEERANDHLYHGMCMRVGQRVAEDLARLLP